MKILALLSAAAIVGFAPPNAAGPVQTESGPIEGSHNGGITSYKGIPYAAPPIGELRWRAPRPPAGWQATRKAVKFSPACPQIGTYPLDAPVELTSEDCLTLNLWAPAKSRNGKLPVMVWIHGGGLQNGSGSVPLYAGDRLARRGVIVVTFNYRLGVLGFLAHPELNRESASGGSGNYGLLDQIAALAWVKRNISAFGGDPDRVTIFGQSSGAFSVSALSVSPKAKGLFRRAIAQSGGLFEPVELDSQFTPKGAAAAGENFARKAGAASLAELRNLPVDTLLKVPFRPQFNLDGQVLATTPRAAFAAGTQHRIDLLLGSNADEGSYFLDPARLTRANHRAQLERTFPGPLIDAVGLQPVKSDSEARVLALGLDTDLRFRWDMWAWANRAAKGGTSKVFLYEFARAPSFAPGEIYHGLGATHGAEMAYAFDQLSRLSTSWTKEDRGLAELMAAYWTNFAKTGDPNGRGLPKWPAFASARGPAMVLDLNSSPREVRNVSRLERIEQVYTAFAAAAQ